MNAKRFISLFFCLLLWSIVHSAQILEDSFEKKAYINELLRFMDGVSKKRIILSSPKAGITKRGKFHSNALKEGIQLRKAQIKANLFFKGTLRDLSLNCSPVLKGSLSNPVVELTFLTATGEKQVLFQNSVLLKQNRKTVEFEFQGSPPLDFDDLTIKVSGRLKIYLLKKEQFEISGNRI